MNFDEVEERACLGMGRFMWLSTYLTAWDDGACWHAESSGFACFHCSVMCLVCERKKPLVLATSSRCVNQSSGVESTQKRSTVTFARSDLFYTFTCFGQSF